MMSAAARTELARARQLLDGGDPARARRILRDAAALADGPERFLVELAGLQVEATSAGDAAVLDPLQSLAERAKAAGADDAYALVLLERAARLRAVGRLGDAAHHAELMMGWGERTSRPRLAGAAALALGLALEAAGRIEQASAAWNHGLWIVGPALTAPTGAESGTDDDPLLPSLPPLLRTFAGLLLQHAQAALALGQVGRARDCLDQLRTVPLDPLGQAMTALTAAELSLATGGSAPVERTRGALEVLAALEPSTAQLDLACRLAAVEPDEDRADRALAVAEAAATPLGPAAIERFRLARASVLLRRGDLDAARAALPTGSEEARWPVERALLDGMIALARGDAGAAVEPLLEAAALAEQAGLAVAAGRAWQTATALYRRAGLVRLARRCRERAAIAWSATGLRAPLVSLEVERAWEALITGKADEAAEVLARLDSVEDPEVEAAVALCRGALARLQGDPTSAAAALTRVHDRFVAAGARGAALPPAAALRALGASGPGADETLAWAAARSLHPLDPLAIPRPSENPERD